MASRVRRRRQLDKVANACEQCKKRKVKCSGHYPCEPCIGRDAQCIFKQAEKRVIVSESYLRKLQESYTKKQENQVSTRASSENVTSPELNADLPTGHANMRTSGGNATDGDAITNPLVSATSFYLQDTPGRYRFCGPSSTWSFSQRVFLLLKPALPEFPAPDLPFNVDGTTWELDWTRTSLDSDRVLEGLPSLHDALYLLEVAKFHSYQMLFLFEEEKFLPHLHEFYQKGLEKAKSSPLWFIQYLLIIALAKRTTVTSRSSSSPPGFTFFERAMSLMPDWVGLHRRRPNLGMQILYLAGLYLVSVDMKDAAYAYVGQSLRTCIIEGLPREPPIDLFGIKLANECRNIWWTAYILDRQLSVMVGAPCSIQDSEITCSLPSSYDTSERGTLLTLHVKLSRIMGAIIKSVYTADSKQRRSFIATVQSVLRDMADILRDIENVSTRTVHPTIRTVSTTTSHLFLLYHQCIVLATRPLFLYFLTHRLKRPRSQDRTADIYIPAQLKPLLETSLQSAKASLRILLSLHEQSSLESLIPFNQDNAYFSAFIVVLAFFIEPSLVPDVENYISTVSWLLNAQISNGDLAAKQRSKELDLLQRMTEEIVRVEEQQLGAHHEDTLPRNDLEQRPETENLTSWAIDVEDIDINHTQILDLADQLDVLQESVWGTNFEFEYSNMWN
ncbi:hypothetical protein BDV38DRAFT_237372 [Aspergillus pseudotamarii]|uniref:Zn(2)-C6 fungal-type domain-containing protein n=1 Tax=Aspergillus pseudotamarii TaxID=132259 RepID=A0A5N6T5X5_ASPPS|nr:uncharacterized protein BDV38DRAFT_237372 [Aspergillus pseudotamarii]KAE8141708.1 hypothetical protein BDV38DRAFT_237372 [Aspergillus pseudotamarii]